MSLHIPLAAETERLVDASFLSRLKPSCCFINTARGPIVDEGALLAALNDDGLAAAYLDVLAEEPPRKDSPGAALVAHDRCFVTPHTAWATDQSRRRLVDTACASIAAFLRGDELKIVSGHYTVRAEHGPRFPNIQRRLGAVERVPQLAPRQRRVAVRERRRGEPGQGLGEELEGARLLHGDRERDPFPALAEALERREGAEGPAARRPRRLRLASRNDATIKRHSPATVAAAPMSACAALYNASAARPTSLGSPLWRDKASFAASTARGALNLTDASRSKRRAWPRIPSPARCTSTSSGCVDGVLQHAGQTAVRR